MKKIRVAVLMGGKSSEREVSLSSGAEVLKNLDRDKYEVWGIDVPSELDKLGEIKPDLAFIILHGKGGEDGVIQGYLETLGIKYTGCGVLASAIGMNKRVFRMLMEREGILMASETRKVPCVVKPNCGGSSVGVSIVKENKDLVTAIELAKKYDDEVIVERYIKGIEVSCGILGDPSVNSGQVVVLPVIEIVPKKEFFDYEAKYTKGMSEEICPARLTEKMTKKVKEITLKVFKAIDGRGYARVDFIIKNDKAYLLEINTLPGMTSNSLLPKEAKAMGVNYSQVLDKIVELALKTRL
ncbi:MAG TPA: D-alanine--D-alanine ligase [Candidatus Methanoperedens sp.]|nr:D-alanine--D-alanine ligase [Candidatus Methanoperedens sp.]